jgi:hypothetical protein
MAIVGAVPAPSPSLFVQASPKTAISKAAQSHLQNSFSAILNASIAKANALPANLIKASHYSTHTANSSNPVQQNNFTPFPATQNTFNSLSASTSNASNKKKERSKNRPSK